MTKLLKLLPFLLLATAGLAHEVWLEGPRFRLRPGEAMHVRAFVGQNFAGGPWTIKAAKVRRLVRFGPAPADSTSLTPTNAAATHTFRTGFAFAQPGTHLVLLHSTESFIELPADKFTAYLREEGLDYALKLRQENEETANPGREAYSRCVKTLVQVGDPALVPLAADSACRHAYGLPLELVPEQNPYRLAPDQALTVRVLRGGRPAPGAAVQVWQRQPSGLPTSHFTTRANQSGRVLLRLSGPGPYLLATVDMRPAPPALRARADWQSTWASLTFAGPSAARRLPAKH